MVSAIATIFIASPPSRPAKAGVVVRRVGSLLQKQQLGPASRPAMAQEGGDEQARNRRGVALSLLGELARMPRQVGDLVARFVAHRAERAVEGVMVFAAEDLEGAIRFPVRLRL